MLGASPTAYDLRFRLLDIPGRVHPLFWLTSALLGGLGEAHVDLPRVLTWMICVFVSILVHEYGHGLMAKRFHGSPSIVLHGLGGLCFSQGERTAGERLAVLFAGPGAGFILCGIVLALSSLLLGISGPEHLAVIRDLFGLDVNGMDYFARKGKFHSTTGFDVYRSMIWINLMWGLVNLLPIYPLDGGQVSQVVWKHFDRRDGVRRSHILSLVTAGILAVCAFSRNPQDWYLPIGLGILAFYNFQVLQTLHQAHSYGADQDDEWWRG